MTLKDQIGLGCGVTGVGLIVLSGAMVLGGVLLCGGLGSSMLESLPVVVEIAPPVHMPGTPPGPEVAPKPAPEPEPTRPRPTPRPDPEPTPDVHTVDVGAETRVVARVSVIGDAELVVALSSDGTAIPLPSELPRGAYDLRVTFAGQAAFSAGSIAVHDGSERVVTCRAALGICKVDTAP